jgi:MarR family transcriptional regulator, organic hydroperoxide resistance regulator
MPSPPHLQLRNQLCLALYSATNALTRAYRPLLEPLGLTYPQYLVMLALWEEDGVSVTDLCQRTRLDTGTVTPLLKRLADKGLLVRGRSEEDERRRVITLTREGAALQEAAGEVPVRMACLEVLTPQQGTQLKRLAETLYRNLAERE